MSQVDDDATQREIKLAYRGLAKECHPDYLGNEGHNICILLNEVGLPHGDEKSRCLNVETLVRQSDLPGVGAR